MAKILVAEDDQLTGTMVQDWLAHEQHSVELVQRGDEAAIRLKLYSYDVVILDWDLPGLSGLEVCKAFRAAGGQSTVLMITGKDQVDEKAEGLYSGADDYLTKPFHMKELAARVTALLRRAPVFKPSELQVGKIKLDSTQHTVSVGSEEIHLLPKEFALLEYFLKHPNQVVRAEALLDRVWSSESDSTPSVVKAHIHNLRRKLGLVDNPVITTVHGVGYRLVVE